MNSHSHGCDSCAKICDEAKASVKNLQKKIYALTIVCTSALTLLGEQGAKAVLSTVNSMNSAIAAVDGKKPKETEEHKDATKTSLDNTIQGKPWFEKPVKNNLEHSKEGEEAAKLALAKRSVKKEKQPDVVLPQVSQVAIQNVVADNKNLSLPESINANTQNPADPYSVFLTPSTLPFDVYSTTLALGNNYGFGEYYGYGSLNTPPISVPDAGAVSVFAFGQLINTRKRN